jgi:ABC-type Fe3+ transport system substrate-binding protein
MEKIGRRNFLSASALVLGASAVAPVLAACGGSGSGGAAAAPIATGSLTDQAKQEGGPILLYCLDQGLANDLVSGFTKQYPWAKVSTVVGSDTDIRNRLITESVAGTQTADVITLAGAARSALLQDKVIRAVPISTESGLPSTLVDPTHYAHPLYQYVVVMAYNKNLVSSPPTSMEGLADPQWKGKIAFDEPQNASTAATFLVAKEQQWGKPKWNAWLKGLQANDILITSDASSALSDVQSGQRAICLSSSQDVYALPKSGPVQPGLYPDMVPVVQYAWLTAKGKQPAGGQLMVEWMMSSPGQQAVAKSGRSPVKNIDSPVTLSKQLPAGTTIMPNTQLSFYYNNPTAELNVLDQLWPE